MDLDAILKYERPKESYYDIIGCHQSSTIDQINREYKIRALQLHPDKNLDGNKESLEKFKRLQEAKDVLTDEKTRKSYDTWLNSGIQIPFEQWEKKKGHSMHWASPKQMKLSLQQTDCSSPSSNVKKDDKIFPEYGQTKSNGSLLEKFRNYEI